MKRSAPGTSAAAFWAGFSSGARAESYVAPVAKTLATPVDSQQSATIPPSSLDTSAAVVSAPAAAGVPLARVKPVFTDAYYEARDLWDECDRDLVLAVQLALERNADDDGAYRAVCLELAGIADRADGDPESVVAGRRGW